MKGFDGFSKPGSRLILVAILVIACNLGSAISPTSPAVYATTVPNPSLSRTEEISTTQELSLQPSSPAAILPTNTSTQQPPKTVTVQPSVAPLNRLKTEESDKTAIPPLGIVSGMIGQVNKDKALTDLRKLTGEEPICIHDGCHTIANRQTGSSGLHWAKDYVYDELVRLGYSVEVQDWSKSGYADQNIIARKPGVISPGEEVYLVAHLDGLGTGVETFPGADDNASGVVDLLEVARVLSNYSFSRTLVLLISTGEEHGALGVKSYLGQLSVEKVRSIKYVDNVDMVGYDANLDGVMQLWYGEDQKPSSLALTQMMSNIIQTYQLGLAPKITTGCG